MARVYVYERAVNAIFMDSDVEKQSDRFKGSSKVKEEPPDPDPDPDTIDSASANTSIYTANESTAVEEDRRESINIERTSPAPSKETDQPEIGNTDSVNTEQEEDLTKESTRKPVLRCLRTRATGPSPAKTPHRARRKRSPFFIECDTCFVTFHHKTSFNLHTKEFDCPRCSSRLGSLAAMISHRKCKCSSMKYQSSRKLVCNFCGGWFSNKARVQSHLFHFHGELIEAGRTGIDPPASTDSPVTGTVPEARADLSEPKVRPRRARSGADSSANESAAEKLLSPAEAALKELFSLTRTPFKRRRSPDGTSPKKQRNQVSPLRRKFAVTRVSPRTPINKRMRQTILTDFISLCKDVEKTECPSPEKETTAEDDSAFEQLTTPETSANPGTIEMSTPQRNSVTPQVDTQCSKVPFVRLHIDPGVMMELLSHKIKTEPESPTTPTGRPHFRTPERPGPRSFQLAQRKRRKWYTDTPRQSQRLLSRSYSPTVLKAKYKCRECWVRLERCDQSVPSQGARVATTPKVTSPRVRSLRRRSSRICAASGVPLSPQVTVKLERLSPAKSPPASPPCERPPDSYEAIVDETERKVYRCHVCGKGFTMKENMREHLRLFHVVYMSSICNARYSSMNKMISHYLRQHLVLRRKECCVCGEKFKSLAPVKRHMALHCLKTVAAKKNTLSVDVETSCNVVRKLYKCKGCRKRFWLHQCLVQHEKVCHRYKCTMAKACVPNVSGRPVTKTDPGPVEEPTSQSVTPPTQEVNDTQPTTSLSIAEPTVDPVPSTPTTDDLASPEVPAASGHKRLINGMVCVKGYKVETMDKVKFPCTICGKQFHTFQNLCLHERTFSKPACNPCNLCATTFPTKRLLQLHMLATHTPSCGVNYRFFCKFCKQGFLKKGNLQIHERHFHRDLAAKPSAGPEPTWNLSPVCSICNLAFESYDRFIEHNMYYYKGQVFVCTFCNQSFQGMYQLHHHNKLLHYPDSTRNSYTYTCAVCQEGFNYESHLHAHKFHVHLHDQQAAATPVVNADVVPAVDDPVPVTAKTYACDVCDLNFTNEKELSAHVAEYSSDGELQCDKCGRMCTTSDILMKHFSLNHAGCDISNSYKCSFCGEVSTTSTEMVCHEKHFHGKNEVQTSAGQSPDRAANKRDSNPEPLSSYSCCTCGMSFDSDITLKYHLLEYANIGAHSCNICQRKFTESYLLEVHRLKHTGVYDSHPHRCPICHEAFANVANVRTHVLHLHKYESFGPRKDKRLDAPVEPVVPQNTAKDKDPSTPAVPRISTNATDSSTLAKPNGVSCPECDAGFSTKENLIKYRSKCLDSGDDNCKICKRRFPWATSEQQPGKGDSIASHKCPYCPEVFPALATVYAHMAHAHGKDKLLLPGGDKETTTDNGRVADTPKDRPDCAALRDLRASLEDDPSDVATLVGPNSAERTFYYSCVTCNMQYPTMKQFQAHFGAKHGQPRQPTRETIYKNEADSTINSSTLDEELYDRMLKIHTTGLDTTAGWDAANRPDPPGRKWESGKGETVCDGRSSSANGDADDSIARVVRQRRRPSTAERSGPGNGSPVGNVDVGKLKVRSFAKISD